MAIRNSSPSGKKVAVTGNSSRKADAVMSKSRPTTSASIDDKVFFSFQEVLDKAKKKMPAVTSSQLLHYGAIGKIEFFVAIPDGVAVSDIVNNQKIMGYSYPSFLILSGHDCLKLDTQKTIQLSQFWHGYFSSPPVLQLVPHYPFYPNPMYSNYHLPEPYWLVYENEDIAAISVTEKSLFVSREKLHRFLQTLDLEIMAKSNHPAPPFYGASVSIGVEDCDATQFSSCGHDEMDTRLYKGRNIGSTKSDKDQVRELPTKNSRDISNVVVRKKRVIEIPKDSRHKDVPSSVVGVDLSVDKVSSGAEPTESVKKSTTVALLEADVVNAHVESHQSSILDSDVISANDHHPQETEISSTYPYIATGDVLLNIKEVSDIVKLSKSTIYAKMKAGGEYYDSDFPKNCSVGARAKRFSKLEINAWCAKQLLKLSNEK